MFRRRFLGLVAGIPLSFVACTSPEEKARRKQEAQKAVEKPEAIALCKMIKTHSAQLAETASNEPALVNNARQYVQSTRFFMLFNSDTAAGAADHARQFAKLVGNWQFLYGAFEFLNLRTAAIQTSYHDIQDPIGTRLVGLRKIQSLLDQTHIAIANFTGQYGTYPTILDICKQTLDSYSSPPERSSEIASLLRLKYNITDQELQ
jgi:hypothetical protein